MSRPWGPPCERSAPQLQAKGERRQNVCNTSPSKMPKRPSVSPVRGSFLNCKAQGIRQGCRLQLCTVSLHGRGPASIFVCLCDPWELPGKPLLNHNMAPWCAPGLRGNLPCWHACHAGGRSRKQRGHHPCAQRSRATRTHAEQTQAPLPQETGSQQCCLSSHASSYLSML